jgi:hypothetical protein
MGQVLHGSARKTEAHAARSPESVDDRCGRLFRCGSHGPRFSVVCRRERLRLAGQPLIEALV